MGMQTIVCGYIFSNSADDDDNARIIETYPYDAVYPFRGEFSRPSAGYIGSTISFATSIKSTRDEWSEWLTAFERFFGKLKAASARITFEETEAGSPITFSYLVTKRSSKGTHISRWKTTYGPEEDEISLVV